MESGNRTKVDWSLARCAEIGPEVFCGLNIARGTKSQASLDHARKLCEDCPLISPCAEEAIANNDSDCIRAGVILPVSKKQVNMNELDFAATKGRTARSRTEVDTFMKGRTPRKLPGLTPVLYKYRLPELREHEVYALTKMALPVEVIANKLDITTSVVCVIRAKLLRDGAFTQQELRDLYPTRNRLKRLGL